jgi:hypothetical protein
MISNNKERGESMFNRLVAFVVVSGLVIACGSNSDEEIGRSTEEPLTTVVSQPAPEPTPEPTPGCNVAKSNCLSPGKKCNNGQGICNDHGGGVCKCE